MRQPYPVVALLALACSAGALAQRPPISVGPNIQVSRVDANIPLSEMLAAADPANADRLMAWTMAYDPSRQQRLTIIYTSFDRGKSWASTLREENSRFVGDPTCVYGFGDTAYAALLPIYKGIDREKWIGIYRSADGGRTWGEAARIPFIDREQIGIDRTNGPYRGRLYIYANGERTGTASERLGPALKLRYSRNAGANWSDPVTPPGLERYTTMMPGVGEVLDDGTLIVPFSATRDGKDYLEVATSRDGGASIEEPVVAARRTTCHLGGSGIGFRLAVDRSSGPFARRVYVTFGSEESGRCEVYVVHSDDGGKHWSRAARVNDDRPTVAASRRAANERLAHHTQASIAVNRNGVVGISWYDRRDSLDGYGYLTRISASLDGGESWVPSVPASAAPFRQHASREFFVDAYHATGGASTRAGSEGSPIQSIMGPDNYYFRGAGDTREMVATADGTFFPFWYDNRTGVMQLWTAPVRVSDVASRNGDPVLADLTDVTDKVLLEYKSSRHDPATGRIVTQVALVNKSDQPIVGPIKMRITSLTSPAAELRAVNTANGKSGVGGVWDFTPVLVGGALAAHTESRPIPLEFSATKVDRARLDYDLVQLSTRVVARSATGTVARPR